MSKSTTGAYGDFPDYYYESGNQFGAFLLGKTPSKSWDTRMEETLEADRGPTVFAAGVLPGVTPSREPKQLPSAHAELMFYVRATVSPLAAARILNQLAAARGVKDVPTSKDPYEALDRFALQSLTETDLRTILERMQAVAVTTPRPSKPRRRPKSTKRPASSRKPPKAASRKIIPTESTGADKNERPRGLRTPDTCVICDAPLSLDEQELWSRYSDLFFAHGYCRAHGTKLLKTLGAKPRRTSL